MARYRRHVELMRWPRKAFQSRDVFRHRCYDIRVRNANNDKRCTYRLPKPKAVLAMFCSRGLIVPSIRNRSGLNTSGSGKSLGSCIIALRCQVSYFFHWTVRVIVTKYSVRVSLVTHPKMTLVVRTARITLPSGIREFIYSSSCITRRGRTIGKTGSHRKASKTTA